MSKTVVTNYEKIILTKVLCKQNVDINVTYQSLTINKNWTTWKILSCS